MTFKDAAQYAVNPTTTENGMPAYKSTLNACLDLFFAAGASRKKDITSLFHAAMKENEDLAMRIALWTRDVRGGAGERATFRSFLLELYRGFHKHITKELCWKIAEVGRWDDVLSIPGDIPLSVIKEALLDRKDGLCAKWMPRKGTDAVRLTKYLGLSPRAYRKLLVGLTKVVETQMCAKEWPSINYEHVPSVAMSRYMKAFSRNDAERFTAYREALKKGEAKINANLFPHDVIRALTNYADADLCDLQWKAIKSISTDKRILPMCDVSGSMQVAVSGCITALDICVGLGLFLAERNTGAFKDMIMSFSQTATIHTVTGSIKQRRENLPWRDWGMNTNLSVALDNILHVAKIHNVQAEEMPEVLLIMSDMQFDHCTSGYNSLNMIGSMYKAAGYTMPKVVFWNLNSKSNVPATVHSSGVGLISGYSPSILKAVVNCTVLNPTNLMMEAIMVDRYKLSA